MKIRLNKKIIILFIFAVFFSFFSSTAFAVWDGLPYNPGETNNPECLPSQTDCDVLPALYAGGALGTPSSGVATNLTGTAAGLSVGGNAATATNLTGLTASISNLNSVTGTLGTAAFTASSAYDVSGAAAAVTPTTLGLVIGTNVLAYRTFGTAANNNTGDFVAYRTFGTAANSATTDFAPALGTDDNYVTDAQLVVIGNTSGTNSGDNAANSTYANDYRAGNFVAGTNYLAPNGSAASLTNFPTLNQNTTGNAATATNLTGLTATIANLNSVTGTLGTAAFTASTAYDVAGAAASVTPTTLGLVIGTNVLAYRTFGTAANSATTDFAPALGVDDNYVTDAQLVVIGNTSGTNSGDNAANTTYASDYRAGNFVAGTNYLAPNGSAAALTSFPTLNQNTTGNAGTVTNGVYTNAANSFSLTNPITTLAESWIGPSSTTGIYFKGGNVGIGTTAPQKPLHVDSTSTGDFTLRLSGDIDGGNYWSGIQFGLTGYATNYAKAGIIVRGTSGNVQPEMHFILDNTADASNADINDAKLSILPSGNVGIGTTAPGYKLQVAGETYINAGNILLDAAYYVGSTYRNYKSQVGATVNSSLQSSGNLYLNIDSDNNVTDSAFIVANNATDASGSELFRIQENGNVGIGTTGPVKPLDVVGSVRSSGNSDSIGQGGYALGTVAAGDYINLRRTTTGNNFALDMYNGSWINAITVLNSNGNVGIGTTTPGAILDVQPVNGTAIALRLTGGTTGSSNNTQLRFGGRKTGDLFALGTDISTNNGSQNFQIYDLVNSVTRLTMDNTGNVGIGTTAPNRILDVKTNASTNFPVQFTTTDWTATVGSRILFGFGANTGDTYSVAQAYSAGATALNNLALNPYGGNVGIGTTAPGYKLQITSTGTGAGSASLSLNESGVRQWILGAGVTTSGNFSIVNGSGGTDPLTINSSGNVGIGTTTPGGLLHIYGSSATLYPRIESIQNGGNSEIGFIGKTAGAVAQAWDAGMNIATTDGAFEIYDRTNSLARLHISTTGNIGIGTASPGKTLSVNGTVGIGTNGGPSGPQLYVTSGASTRSILTVSDGNTASVMLAGGNSLNGVVASDAGLTFRTGATYTAPDSGGVTAMTILTSGNVGIGTTTPGQKLEVGGNIIAGTGNYIGFRYSPSDPVSYGYITMNGASPFTIVGGLYTAGNIEAIRFQTQAVTAAMSILNNGNVGIGTTGPTNALAVVGSISIGSAGVARGTTAGTNRLDIFNGTAPVGTLTNGISLYSTSGELRVMDAAGNATLLSPHDVTNNYWVFDSVNEIRGTSLLINMEEMMKKLNESFGWDYVHEIINGVATTSTNPAVNLQELNLDLNAVAGTIIPIPGSASESFLASFITNLKAKIGVWLADAGNGISDIFAKKATLDQICLKDANGTSCYTRTQIDSLLANTGTTPPPAPLLNQGGEGGGNSAPALKVLTCTPPQILVNNICMDPIAITPPVEPPATPSVDEIPPADLPVVPPSP